MDPVEPLLHPGDRLDRYELLCPIASGGMATVWLARLRGKRGFEKLFAVKTIRTELHGDQRFQEMFLDEARIASGIQHPNVAQILDLGEQAQVLYLVMEWVDGE
jgi:serine/threonine protein kinase